MIKKYQSEIKIFIVIFLGLFVILSNFTQMHFSQDTYSFISLGYRGYGSWFLRCGRVICSLSLLIANFFKIPPNIYVSGMGIISVFFLSLAITVFYTTLKRYLNKCSLVTIGALSILTILNFCTVELLVFAESGVLTFGVLLSVIAGCAFSLKNKKKYLLIIILGFLSVLCHQAVFNIFVSISFIVIILSNGNKFKKIFFDIILCLFCYGVDIISGQLFIKIINIIFNVKTRTKMVFNISNIIPTYKNYFPKLFFETLGIGTKYWYLILLCFIFILFFIINFKQ